MAEKYIIRVTAGTGYDVNNHVVVPVNRSETTKLTSALVDAEINVRVRNYHGLPRGSPETSPYFALEPHAANADQYSIAIQFTLKNSSATKTKVDGIKTIESSSTAGDSAATEKGNGSSSSDKKGENNEIEEKEADGVSGHDLQFGNDFDHPIRDRLPPGFSYAMNIVKWWIDPGLDGDPYADRPHLYGPALSSFNSVHVGAGTHDAEKGGLYFEEGGDEAGLAARRDISCPEDAAHRKKWALGEEAKTRWRFEYGKTYCVDFFNPYLDFSEFALRLPGFTLPIMKYWDGQGLSDRPKRSHSLRYVLRNRATDETYLVVVFSLYLKEDVNEDGSLKPSALEAGRGKFPQDNKSDGDDGDKSGAASTPASAPTGGTADDDVD